MDGLLSLLVAAVVVLYLLSRVRVWMLYLETRLTMDRLATELPLADWLSFDEVLERGYRAKPAAIALAVLHDSLGRVELRPNRTHAFDMSDEARAELTEAIATKNVNHRLVSLCDCSLIIRAARRRKREHAAWKPRLAWKPAFA